MPNLPNVLSVLSVLSLLSVLSVLSLLSLPAAAQGPAAASETARGTAAAGVSRRNASGIAFGYEVPQKIALGQTVALRLHFAGAVAPEGAQITVRDPAARRIVLTLHLRPGEQRSAELLYTARADGMQYLDVFMSQAGRGNVQSVPLRVGSGRVQLKAEGKPSITPRGEALIHLPAK